LKWGTTPIEVLIVPLFIKVFLKVVSKSAIVSVNTIDYSIVE
jgi:hypothetical protein